MNTTLLFIIVDNTYKYAKTKFIRIFIPETKIFPFHENLFFASKTHLNIVAMVLYSIFEQ